MIPTSLPHRQSSSASGTHNCQMENNTKNMINIQNIDDFFSFFNVLLLWRYFGHCFNKIADRIEKYGYFWDNDRNVILDISIDRI